MRWNTMVSFMLVSGLLQLPITAEVPQRVPIWPSMEAPNGDGNTSAASTRLTIYRAEQTNGAAVIICPGGGYGGLAIEPEGHGIATWLSRHGITGMVLEYRLPQGRPMVPLSDAQRAIRLARANAGAWGIDPHRLGIMGFSAGGHLAATAATRFDLGATQQAAQGDPVQRFSSRPDFAVLVYPVITMGKISHAGSRNNLLGKNPSADLIADFSAERQVTQRTPPVFLAHAKDDALVPIENSLLFANACEQHDVPCAMLKLESGGHGLNNYQGPSWDTWQKECLSWLEARGFLSKQAMEVNKLASTERFIAATDSDFLHCLSPLNWIHGPKAVHASVCGASWLGTFSGTSRVFLNVDTTGMIHTSPWRYPILGWSIDGGPVQSHQLVAGETRILLCDRTKNPTIDLHIRGMSPFEDRFTGDVPPNRVTITGFTVEQSCSGIAAPPTKPLWLNIGDSILSGDAAAYALNQGRPPNDLWAGSDDARASYGYLLATHFGYQESRLAFGGYAWTGGLGHNPPLAKLADQLTSTVSRLSADTGKFSPTPRVVLINLGENGVPPVDAVTSALANIRQRCHADTRILVMIPVSGRGRAEITNAVEIYLQSSADKHTHVIDPGAVNFDSSDGQHPTTTGHRMIYQKVLPLLEPWLK